MIDVASRLLGTTGSASYVQLTAVVLSTVTICLVGRALCKLFNI